MSIVPTQLAQSQADASDDYWQQCQLKAQLSISFSFEFSPNALEGLQQRIKLRSLSDRIFMNWK
ncbi:hypothetical protein [Coleofasciculus sp. FACHB-1120]|uniref:hypothetical protein n=1 Tax=Coleofasciculus sp. FACHB-1120 TaxID=2692783 RepID=UPI00168A2D81|nr:hypothetical protein [Coleofasciculus sp. FACHB-1120]MBD2744426.1 hypothetical protein [Coleofasciculus sp. FACHB-1120]